MLLSAMTGVIIGCIVNLFVALFVVTERNDQGIIKAPKWFCWLFSLLVALLATILFFIFFLLYDWTSLFFYENRSYLIICCMAYLIVIIFITKPQINNLNKYFNNIERRRRDKMYT